MKVAVQFDASRTLRALEARRRRMRDELAGVVSTGAGIVADRWRATVPVGPDPTHPAGRPHYRDTINVRLEEDTPTRITHVVASGVSDDHDIWLEYGTSEMAAQPSARPAREASRETVRSLMRTVPRG